ncbi:MAG: hypothetical protein JW767_02385 [Thermoleophilia bacterium]|nr:hypothetical protein [Thermoleophilia bacterium]
MLVVLLVGAVAALASASLVAAVLSASATDAADRGRDACAAGADAGLRRLLEQVRWGLTGESASMTLAAEGGPPAVGTTLQVRPGSAAADGTFFSTLELSAASSAGAARVLRWLTALLRPGVLPHGLAAAGDLVVLAPVEIGACGVYVGGDVLGREQIAFEGAVEPLLAPPDLLYPELYSATAVHAAGAIYTAEGEIHDLPSPTLDTDVHVGEPYAAELSALPGPALLAGLQRHATGPGPALAGDLLRVDLLPAQPPAEADPGAGLIVYVEAGARLGPLVVAGRREPPPVACPLVLVIEGDAVLGGDTVAAPEEPACELNGAVLATGDLRVDEATRLTGSLAADGMVIAAPLALRLDEAWLAWPPAGCREFEVVRRW